MCVVYIMQNANATLSKMVKMQLHLWLGQILQLHFKLINLMLKNI